MHSGKPQKAKKERGEGREGGGGGVKFSTGSNEPQKYFGRSDHVEALSQLGPLRSRKGMSQLGIPNLDKNLSSLGLGHLRSLRAALVLGRRQTPVRRVHGRHSTGSSRTGTGPDTLMDMRTDLTAVPHASLSYLEGLRCQEIVG